MRITDRDNAGHVDAARIIGPALWAVLRRRDLTPKQKARIDEILSRADRREAGKSDVRQAVEDVLRRQEFEGAVRRNVDKETRRRESRRWW